MSRASAAAVLTCLALMVLSGCARNPAGPVGSARVTLAVRWAPAASASADSLIDRLTAEGLDVSGVSTGDTATLEILPDRSFHGTLTLRAGAGRQVRVRAFAHGDEFYRGTSEPFSIHPDDTVRVSVALAPAVALRLAPVVRPVVFGDSVDLALRCTATAAVRGVQVDVRYDPALLAFARPMSNTPELSGFDWAVTGPGRVRVLAYGGGAAERVTPGDSQTLWVLRFASCQPGVCGFVRASAVALEAVTATGVHGLSQPLTATADSVVFQP